MNIEQAVVEKLRIMPVDKQQEVLDFVEFLEQKANQQALPLNQFPLRGKVIRYDEPFESAVPLEDWEALR